VSGAFPFCRESWSSSDVRAPVGFNARGSCLTLLIAFGDPFGLGKPDLRDHQRLLRFAQCCWCISENFTMSPHGGALYSVRVEPGYHLNCYFNAWASLQWNLLADRIMREGKVMEKRRRNEGNRGDLHPLERLSDLTVRRKWYNSNGGGSFARSKSTWFATGFHGFSTWFFDSTWFCVVLHGFAWFCVVFFFYRNREDTIVLRNRNGWVFEKRK